MTSSTLPRVCRFQRPVSKAGYTLLELLIVIGIIALLIGMLMPMFGVARESANSIKCAAQERQILMAMTQHANEHEGYMPMVGLPHPTLLDPDSLQDPQRLRYDYYGTDSSNFHLMSVLGALAPQLGQQIDARTMESMEAGIQSGVVRQIFHCPSDRDEQQIGHTVVDGGDEYNSYAFNEAPLGKATSTYQDGSGLTNTPNAHSRTRAKVSEFVHPEQLCLLTDGTPRSDGGWLVYCDVDSDLTLRDYFLTSYGPPNNPHLSSGAPSGYCAAWDLFDMNRHRGRMNVGFADGHVENVALDEGSLANVSMSKDFPAYWTK